MSKPSETTPIKFHFCSITFTPYSDNRQESSESILKKVLDFVIDTRKNGNYYLIDRHEHRDDEEPRELFMTSAYPIPKENRVRCSIALFRTGRLPKIKPENKERLVPIAQMGTIAEETHFYIDYSKSKPIFCVEYNHHGPRIPDIEYYLRSIAWQKLKIAKGTKIEIFMGGGLNKAIREFKNVLNFDVKILPQKIEPLNKVLGNNYFSGLSLFGNVMRPKYFNIQASFQTDQRAYTVSNLNTPANSMCKALLQYFEKAPANMDSFENFILKYESKDGTEEVFNLLKQKKGFVKELKANEFENKILYDKVKGDIDTFVKSVKL